MEAPDFWDDPEKSQAKMKQLKSMKDDMETYRRLEEAYSDIETMIEMGYEENDASLIPEIQEMMDEFKQVYEEIHMKTLLSGEYDRNDAIVSLHAGAGGSAPPHPGGSGALGHGDEAPLRRAQGPGAGPG